MHASSKIKFFGRFFLRYFVLVLLLNYILCFEVFAGYKECLDSKQLETAENSFVNVSTWKEMYELYIKYGGCYEDVGSEAVAYSISYLIGTEWDDHFQKNIEDVGFRMFLLSNFIPEFMSVKGHYYIDSKLKTGCGKLSQFCDGLRGRLERFSEHFGVIDCDEKVFDHLNHNIAKVVTWADFQIFFAETYSERHRCKSVSIENEYVDTLLNLYTSEWDSFKQGAIQFRKNKDFGFFVYLYTDRRNWDKSQLDVVYNNLKKDCPADFKDICDNLIEKLAL